MKCVAVSLTSVMRLLLRSDREAEGQEAAVSPYGAATGRAAALTSVQKRTAHHYSRKWLRDRANISRSNDHAYFLLPRPPPSSRRLKPTFAVSWPANACTGPRSAPSGPSSRTTSRPSNAPGALPVVHGSRPRWCRTLLQRWPASEPTPGRINGSANEGAGLSDALALARPAPRPVVAVEPRGGLGVRDRVEWRLARPRRASPGAGHELEQAGGATFRVDRVGVVARLAIGDVDRPLDRRRPQRAEGVVDDLGNVGRRRRVIAAGCDRFRLGLGCGQRVLLRLVLGQALLELLRPGDDLGQLRRLHSFDARLLHHREAIVGAELRHRDRVRGCPRRSSLQARQDHADQDHGPHQDRAE